MNSFSLTQSLEFEEGGEIQNTHQLEIAGEEHAIEEEKAFSERRVSSVRDGGSDKDLEVGTDAQQTDEEEQTAELHDPNIVGWEGDEDPANPMNWSATMKWTMTGIVSLITFIVPLASSMFAPGVTQVTEEFHVSNTMLEELVVSIYILGLAFGPLLLAPLSEVYGRWVIYTVSNIFYTVMTIACAVSSDMSMLIVWRFLAGCAGSSPLAIGAGTIADLFPIHQRGLALSFYALGPIVGPGIGPVVGGFLAEAKGWRWIFWLLTIMSGAITVAQIAFMKETYAVTLLARKTKRLQKSTGNLQLRSKLDSGIPAREILIRAIIRPAKLTLLSPISILLSITAAFIYGILYLLLTTFPLVFEAQYGFSIGISGLTYIGLAVGNTAGLFIFSMTSDRYVSRRAAQGKLKPEDRLFPYFLVAGPLIAGGLFWYGWTAQAKTLWIAPIVGSALVGLGNMLFFMPVMGYLVDAFTVYAASAVAANTVLRSVGGALLPLAAESMYASLNYGWGNSLLAFLTLAFSPALIALYLYGERIRLRYPVKV
ncbi:hypothetical protein ASPZODRAFT_127631 [Penicilliopsis zonata CBS 506.65]|uniref:Major facilitator superfamily (MFS) profile domain-containing protein n=1 Tax=Penicilliopsis zonata CBS 506.65 TaxID=1073090 RepID=A0A1L9SWG8_9EURO|nr:hypothetical protein ASPZODRAFT_127631 [Penicilliopsis zonata CBS 506.65]OJJ51540.1 hypothetical protein ASPZODRAFT_127631 [Penicilliopsis zonata CBS 506.65]